MIKFINCFLILFITFSTRLYAQVDLNYVRKLRYNENNELVELSNFVYDSEGNLIDQVDSIFRDNAIEVNEYNYFYTYESKKVSSKTTYYNNELTASTIYTLHDGKYAEKLTFSKSQNDWEKEWILFDPEEREIKREKTILFSLKDTISKPFLCEFILYTDSTQTTKAVQYGKIKRGFTDETGVHVQILDSLEIIYFQQFNKEGNILVEYTYNVIDQKYAGYIESEYNIHQKLIRQTFRNSPDGQVLITNYYVNKNKIAVITETPSGNVIVYGRKRISKGGKVHSYIAYSGPTNKEKISEEKYVYNSSNQLVTKTSYSFHTRKIVRFLLNKKMESKEIFFYLTPE